MHFSPEQLETVVCDLCGSAAQEVLFEKDGFPIVRCTDCGLVYVSPRLKPEALLSEVYNESYFTSDTGVGSSDHFGAEAAGRRAKARRDLSWLRRLGVTGGQLVEIGSAGGFFVDEARKAGFDASGFEPEKHAARHAAETLHVPVTHGTWESLQTLPEPVDMFYLSHVLEHLPSPTAALTAMARHLKPGGHVALEVPHWDCLPNQRQGAHWVIIAPLHHLYYFRTADLQHLARKAGLRWVAHRYPELGLVDLLASSGTLGAAGVADVARKKNALKRLLGPLKNHLQGALGALDRNVAAPLLARRGGVVVQVLLQKPLD